MNPRAEPARRSPARRASARACLDRLGITGAVETLPYVDGDATAGSESEWQATVEGRAEDVDLAAAIRSSDFLAQHRRRADAGDVPRRVVDGLLRHLDGDTDGVWENSWVRVPVTRLGPGARRALCEDGVLPWVDAPRLRGDAARFGCAVRGEPGVRVPISYLLKLALLDAVDGEASPILDRVAQRAASCFVNDHVSPETHSLHVVRLAPELGNGRALAREAGRRRLLASLLLDYATERYGLRATGQVPRVYDAPHPPVRQRELAGLIDEETYRELFMSPCLNGWSDGERKQEYMAVCHRALSRSQMLAMLKLRDAGILRREVVRMPRPTVSLSNNGVHVSLGSARLTRAAAAGRFDRAGQAAVGDLALKISEHFLPLLVGLYTAAPYRLAYAELLPERALGYLPHQLQYRHLRMLWRRWQKKAIRAHLTGRRLPSGVPWLDSAYAAATGQPGDFVPDVRLLDYLVAPLSPDTAPALSGRLDGELAYRDGLHRDGVMDRSMSVYLPAKVRSFDKHRFFGTEWRTHSAFIDDGDLAAVAELQAVVTALATRWIADGAVTHGTIPDDAFVESERRQILFAAAADVPTFYVRKDTRNLFLGGVVSRTRGCRPSRRYPGFVRVQVAEFRRALVATLEREAWDIVDALGARDTVDDLRQRVVNPSTGAAARLTADICRSLGVAHPMDAPAHEFNKAAERHYRTGLRRRLVETALEQLADDAARIDGSRRTDAVVASTLDGLVDERSAADFVRAAYRDAADGALPADITRRLVGLVLVAESLDARDHAGDAR